MNETPLFLPPENTGPTELFLWLGDLFGYLYATYLKAFVDPYVPMLKALSITLILLFIAGLTYAVLTLREARMRERLQYRSIDVEEREAAKRLTQWEVINDHLDAENPAEWRLAILEADNILDDLLARHGYEGENLGERLRGLTRHDLVALDDAWEAHKVRNQIAHEGSGFDLTNRVARQVIARYERVFRELGYF